MIQWSFFRRKPLSRQEVELLESRGAEVVSHRYIPKFEGRYKRLWYLGGARAPHMYVIKMGDEKNHFDFIGLTITGHIEELHPKRQRVGVVGFGTSPSKEYGQPRPIPGKTPKPRLLKNRRGRPPVQRPVRSPDMKHPRRVRGRPPVQRPVRSPDMGRPPKMPKPGTPGVPGGGQPPRQPPVKPPNMPKPKPPRRNPFKNKSKRGRK